MVGGEGDDQLGGVDVIAGCHCRVPLNVLWLWGRVMAKFGVVDVVPLQGAIAGCVKRSCLELFADVASSSTLIT